MAVRKLRYQDDEILRNKCKEVEKVDDSIREILNDMLDTLRATSNGAAIAASQVGLLKRLVVIDVDGKVLKLVNPRIIETSGTQECVEACLSFPGRAGITVRPMKVTVQALNEYGEEVILEGEDFMAKCFCHELDHLDGVVFLDHVIEFVEIQD